MGEYHRQKTAHCGRFLLLIVFFYSSKRKPAYFVFFSLISSLYQDHLNAELERKPNMPFFNTKSLLFADMRPYLSDMSINTYATFINPQKIIASRSMADPENVDPTITTGPATRISGIRR